MIREPGTGHGDEPPIARVAYPSALAATASRAGEAAPRIEVDPGEVEIFGAVELEFSLECG